MGTRVKACNIVLIILLSSFPLLTIAFSFSLISRSSYLSRPVSAAGGLFQKTVFYYYFFFLHEPAGYVLIQSIFLSCPIVSTIANALAPKLETCRRSTKRMRPQFCEYYTGSGWSYSILFFYTHFISVMVNSMQFFIICKVRGIYKNL